MWFACCIAVQSDAEAVRKRYEPGAGSMKSPGTAFLLRQSWLTRRIAPIASSSFDRDRMSSTRNDSVRF